MVRAAWFLYPFLMAFVIVATANHFIFDALLGAATAGVSAYGAAWLARARPAVWRFAGASAHGATAHVGSARVGAARIGASG